MSAPRRKRKAKGPPTVRAVVAGEKWTVPPVGEVTIAAKGQGNSGQWICYSCAEIFTTQMGKDCHINEPGEHVLGWYSHVSGEHEEP